MKVCYCDRCGKKINYTSESMYISTFVPVFKIVFYEKHCGQQRDNIDLCLECSRELHKWIFGHGEKDGEL